MAVNPCGAKLDRAMNGSQVVLRRGGGMGPSATGRSMAAKFSSQLRKQRPSQGELGKGYNAEVHQQADSKRKGNGGPPQARPEAAESESKRQQGLA